MLSPELRELTASDLLTLDEEYEMQRACFRSAMLLSNHFSLREIPSIYTDANMRFSSGKWQTDPDSKIVV
jgi:hypothetical protein